MEQVGDEELMDRASRALADVVAARLEEERDERSDGRTGEATRAPRVVALVGRGNNGGDALWALAHLAERWDGDLQLTVVQVADVAHPAGLKAARQAGATVLVPGVHGDQGGSGDQGDDSAATSAEQALADADLVLDGIAGLGSRPGLDPATVDLVDAIGPQAYVVAVDLPSGADPSGETIPDSQVYADETVTFIAPKPVHVLAGATACGLLTVVDIGVELDPDEHPVAQSLEFDDVPHLWPVPGPRDDKYTRGVLGVVAGGQTYTGAAVLSTLSAVESGVGMVRYVGPDHAADQVRGFVPEAVFGNGRVQAHVVGPGLDVDDDSEPGRAQVQAARDALDSTEPCVVDAGALSLLDGPRAQAGARSLLTPHAGELATLLARLDGDVTVEQVTARPVQSARRAAELLHATVLLKGATTYVVPPPRSGLPVRAQSDAPAWLGTAGSGDVLAGLCGALLAAGLDPLDAGSLAALVHGVAGHDANPHGPVRATRVAQQIPRTVAHLLTRRP